ncbi:DNA primase [Treponema brennaborense]|uniref:DNA primase n=1 Tax=Treponema brennaborense (strain DSM 12168 / CIP 105900 / DD5/3) TaxID=906968 RepID=F4LMP0_TREBD|nr:DNA primase [Treponema brennaborense]AEE16787.1 DNA primase [Treponema brennaborense DSM 12168]
MAGLISQDTIRDVVDRTDLVSLVGEYTRLENRGTDWWGCCPFHSEKTPSFHVVPDRKMYYCFGCHEGGNAIDFCMSMEKLSFTEAVVSLAKRAGVEVVYSGGGKMQVPEYDTTKDQYIDLYTRVAGSYHYFLTATEAGKFALDYVTERGLTAETIAKFKLGYSPADRHWLGQFLRGKNYSAEFLEKSGLFSKKYQGVSFFSDRLMFPIFDRKGQVVAFGGRLLHGDGPKYINSGDLIQYKKGETLYAFNFARQAIRESKSVIFCEGYMDVIAYHQCGITNAVAPLGTALTGEQVKLVRSFADTVYLSFDSDGAGKAATWKAILLCREADLTVKIIQLQGAKDPAEIMIKYGRDTLTNYVKNAIIDSDYLLSILAKEHQIDTPEGKTKAALAFFPYIDALKSDMQKESCLALLWQTFNLNPEAVKRDFTNRADARKRISAHESDTGEHSGNVSIKLNAELRAVLVVISNFDSFALMRTTLTADDFEDPLARSLFITLEECYREDSVSYSSILAKCGGEQVKNMVAKVVTSGEYAENPHQLIEDSIKLIKRNSLERKRTRLMNRIRQFKVATLEDQKELDALLSEKMTLDYELNNK